MLEFDDTNHGPEEPKSARMEQRTKPHVKAEIQRAAALLGVDETAFVVNSAYERARQTIQDHERTILKAEERQAFFEALENPADPTSALRDAVELNRRLVIDDE